MTILPLIIAVLPPLGPITDRVTRIELNHVYNGDGDIVIDQIILWDWNKERERFDVVHWLRLSGVRLVGNDGELLDWNRSHPRGPPFIGKFRRNYMVPRREGGIYAAEYWDREAGSMRRIEADIFLETWTSYDREVVEREILPQSQRRGLQDR